MASGRAKSHFLFSALRAVDESSSKSLGTKAREEYVGVKGKGLVRSDDKLPEMCDCQYKPRVVPSKEC